MFVQSHDAPPPPLPPQLFFGMITSAINALLCVILPSSPFLDDDLIMMEQGLTCHVHLKTPNAKYAKLAEPFYSKLERTIDNYTTHSDDSTTPSRFRFRHSRHLFTYARRFFGAHVYSETQR